MLYDYQRKEIEQAFGCPVYNFYGSREVNNIAAECSTHEGLHIFASGRIIEIVDDNGKSLPSGEIGYIAVTDLTNFSFPFIRYRNGDMASIKKEPCSCGRNYPLLNDIAGREYDIMTFGGRYIHGQFFPNLFYQQPDVRQFQVIQETADRLLIRVVAPKRQLDVAYLKKKVREKAGQDVQIDVEFVDKIPCLKSGKYRFTINNYRSKNRENQK
jgi:phenylacetate-CoA ligase